MTGSRSHSTLAAESGLEFRVPALCPMPFALWLILPRGQATLLEAWAVASSHLCTAGSSRGFPRPGPRAPSGPCSPVVLLHGRPHPAEAAQHPPARLLLPSSQTGTGQPQPRLRRFHGNSRGPRSQPNRVQVQSDGKNSNGSLDGQGPGPRSPTCAKKPALPNHGAPCSAVESGSGLGKETGHGGSQPGLWSQLSRYQLVTPQVSSSRSRRP